MKLNIVDNEPATMLSALPGDNTDVREKEYRNLGPSTRNIQKELEARDE